MITDTPSYSAATIAAVSCARTSGLDASVVSLGTSMRMPLAAQSMRWRPRSLSGRRSSMLGSTSSTRSSAMAWRTNRTCTTRVAKSESAAGKQRERARRVVAQHAAIVGDRAVGAATRDGEYLRVSDEWHREEAGGEKSRAGRFHDRNAAGTANAEPSHDERRSGRMRAIPQRDKAQAHPPERWFAAVAVGIIRSKFWLAESGCTVAETLPPVGFRSRLSLSRNDIEWTCSSD